MRALLRWTWRETIIRTGAFVTPFCRWRASTLYLFNSYVRVPQLILGRFRSIHGIILFNFESLHFLLDRLHFCYLRSASAEFTQSTGSQQAHLWTPHTIHFFTERVHKFADSLPTQITALRSPRMNWLKTRSLPERDGRSDLPGAKLFLCLSSRIFRWKPSNLKKAALD